MKSIRDYETVALDDENSAVVIIDQTLLPGKTEIISLKTGEEIWNAIYLLKVRGDGGFWHLSAGEADRDGGLRHLLSGVPEAEGISGFLQTDCGQSVVGAAADGAGMHCEPGEAGSGN